MFKRRKKNKEVVKLDASKIAKGTLVNYGFFSGIMFRGIDRQGQVILQDRYGNVKRVSRDLFEKDAKIAEKEEGAKDNGTK